MSDCIFCKIVKEKISAYKIYEDDKTLAFLDIAPVTPGHSLIIPKKHFVNLEEIPQKDLSDLILVVKKVGRAIKDRLAVKGYNVNVNNDPVAGQIIPHLHFHIIPRHKGDSLELWPQGEYNEGEAENIQKILKID